jgi:hypothetical protein
VSPWIDHPLHCSCVECVARDPRYAGRRGTARSLIELLAWRGVSFRLVDGKVRFRPTTLLTKVERSEIRRVKDEVYQLLREDEDRRRRGESNLRSATKARSSRWRGAPSSRAEKERHKAGG